MIGFADYASIREGMEQGETEMPSQLPEKDYPRPPSNGAEYGARFAEAFRKLEVERDALAKELAEARSYIADVISKNDRLMAVSKIEIDALQLQLSEEKSRVLSFQNDWKDMAERANRVEAVLSAVLQIVRPYEKPPLPAMLTDVATIKDRNGNIIEPGLNQLT